MKKKAQHSKRKTKKNSRYQKYKKTAAFAAAGISAGSLPYMSPSSAVQQGIVSQTVQKLLNKRRKNIGGRRTKKQKSKKTRNAKTRKYRR